MQTKVIFALMLLVSSTIGKAQQLYFSKSNYTDSTTIAKKIPELARSIIALHPNTKEVSNKDNLFRLQLVAQNYTKVLPTLQELAQEIYTDSTGIKAIGFSFRIFANTLNNHPNSKEAFETVFKKQFFKVYDDLNDDGKTMVDQYYERDLVQLKSDFQSKVANAMLNDSISIADAVALCRSYCSYYTFSSTMGIATQLLQKISDEKYEVDENVVLTMADGGTIALTIVRNKKITQPLPVVLKYNIYAGADVTACKDAANRGFVGIIANTRGKRLSKDAIEPFEHDANDAYQIIDWISKQPWCDGKVGMYGGSYLGFSQWSAVKKLHPALKTIVPQVAVGAGIDFPLYNGVFINYMLRWIHFVSNTKLTDLAEFNDTTHWEKVFKDFYTSGKSFREFDAVEGRPNALFQRWLQHPTYDSYWQNTTPQKEEYGAIDIPILTTTGYYDDDQLGAMHYYKEYQKWNKSNNYYLVIGPYDHFGAQGYPQAVLNDYTIDEVANIPIHEIIFEWFNYTLKDGPKPEVLKDKVNYQLMGTNTWNHTPSLAKMSNSALTFHLSSKQKKGSYSLTTTATTKDFIPLTIDFKDRSTIKINSDTSYCGFEAFQPSALPERKNLIVLESEPLTEPLAITGALQADLVFETNKKDLDIQIEMYEKKADGTYFALTSNLQRASLAKDKSTRQLLIPNTKQSIPVYNNFMACKQLEKGSSIVILLGVYKGPDYQMNFGSGKDVSDENIADAKIPLQIKWFADSTIVIPVLK
jgi:uncharacterized protein